MTARQLQVLRLLATAERDHEPCPTIRELAVALGVRATNAVTDHLNALERRGLLTRSDGKSRSIRITEAGRAAANLGPTPQSYGIVRATLLEKVYRAARQWDETVTDRLDAAHALTQAVRTVVAFEKSAPS